MLNKKKTTPEAMEQALVDMIVESLASIYSNRSSDEYKSHGDITLTSEYKSIEKMVGDLTYVKKFPTTTATDIKTLFLTLHRPIWKTMVTAYMQEKNEQNTLFTAVYTVGYRVLLSELSRIYAATVATDKGIAYQPDKASKKSDMTAFIRHYNASLETKINQYLKSVGNTVTQEAMTVPEFIVGVTKLGKSVNKAFDTVFKVLRKAIRLDIQVGSVLDLTFKSKVDQYRKIAVTYLETKNAYEEYVRIPQSQQNEKVKSKYIAMLKKYEIKMENARAALEHYDSRAMEETREKVNDIMNNDKPETPSENTTDSSDTPVDNNDTGFNF